MAAESASRISSLDQLLKLIAHAQRIDFTGYPPYESGAEIPIVRYPVRLQHPSEIREVAEFFRRSNLRFDENMTSSARHGDSMRTSEVTTVTIDGKFAFDVVGTDHVGWADPLIYCYEAPETPGPLWSYFHRDLALLIAKINRRHAGTKSAD